jgi:hypothetical protein
MVVVVAEAEAMVAHNPLARSSLPDRGSADSQEGSACHCSSHSGMAGAA